MEWQDAIARFVILSVLIIAIPSHAQNKILKVSDKSHRVGIELGTLKVGDTVEAKSNGKSCQIKIVKVTDKLAVGDAASCDSIAALNGQAVTLSSGDENWDEDTALDWDNEPQDNSSAKTKNARPKEHEKKKIGLGFAVYYSFADSIKAAGGLGSTPFSETDKTDPQLGLSLHYNNIAGHHFGSFVSLDYELERKIKSGSGTIGGISYSGTPNDATFSFINVTTNIGYGISNEFSAYLGINYPVSITAKNSGASYVGSIGGQGGIEYKFTDVVSGSLEYRFIKAKGTVSGTNPVTGQPVTGSDDLTFDGALLRLGFNF